MPASNLNQSLSLNSTCSPSVDSHFSRFFLGLCTTSSGAGDVVGKLPEEWSTLKTGKSLPRSKVGESSARRSRTLVTMLATARPMASGESAALAIASQSSLDTPTGNYLNKFQITKSKSLTQNSIEQKEQHKHFRVS